MNAVSEKLEDSRNGIKRLRNVDVSRSKDQRGGVVYYMKEGCVELIAYPVVQNKYGIETAGKINVKNETFCKLLTHCDKKLAPLKSFTICQ